MRLEELKEHEDFDKMLQVIAETGATPALVIESLADRIIHDLGQLYNLSLDKDTPEIQEKLAKHRIRLLSLRKHFFKCETYKIDK